MMTTIEAASKARKSPKKLFRPYITDMCTGCGGKPVCRIYCKFGAITLVIDEDNYPYKKAKIDEMTCTGCRACISKGKQGTMLTGCPFNAIRLRKISGVA